MKAINKGFTLIELMIVIAIVAILVALAVPAYQDYVKRTKVGECINNGAVPKLQISEYYQSENAWPAGAAEAGINADTGDTQYCLPMTYNANGVFTVNPDGPTIGIPDTIVAVLTPGQAPGGEINWTCSRGGTTATNYKYLPSSCRAS
jgi:type IV pilus assembly protein PilA